VLVKGKSSSESDHVFSSSPLLGHANDFCRVIFPSCTTCRQLPLRTQDQFTCKAVLSRPWQNKSVTQCSKGQLKKFWCLHESSSVLAHGHASILRGFIIIVAYTGIMAGTVTIDSWRLLGSHGAKIHRHSESVQDNTSHGDTVNPFLACSASKLRFLITVIGK